MKVDLNKINESLAKAEKEWLASLVSQVEELQETNAKIIKTADVIDARNQTLIQQVEEMQKTLEEIYRIAKEDHIYGIERLSRQALKGE